VFYFSAISTLVSAVPLCWHWITPAPALWGMLLLLGALGAAGQIFMTHAFALAPAARVGVYGYTSVVFASGLGWMLWGEIVDGLTVGGAGLILMAGLLAVHRQQARKTRKYCLIHLA
jgi:drug/metabolite transporter (DMT)-like permease